MTRRFPARIDKEMLEQEPPYPALLATSPATVRAEVQIDGASGMVDFQIDTGADCTALSPTDAYNVLEERYLQMIYAGDGQEEVIESIGIGGSTSSIVRRAQITLFDEDEQPFPILLGIALVKPDPRQPGQQGRHWTNSDMPSLLGLDILYHFDLRLSYHPPSAVLVEASASS